jgi:RNA polymerase sigma-70 factor (ECF subfamily)
MRSDKELIELIKNGDQGAFEELYYRHRDWVYRLGFRFTSDHEQALDVLQDTFAYLLRKISSLELTAAMTTFLYPVVKHLCLNLKRRKPQTATDNQILNDLPAPPAQTAPPPRAELAAVLAVLGTDQREILLMRFVDDMSLDEIAAALEISLSTVKSRLYRGLETLRHDPRTKEYFLG